MLPPSPPSPPSGPPRGTYFSRRKLRQPLPPSPASTLILASSTNFMVQSSGASCGAQKTPRKAGFVRRCQSSSLLGRDHRDEAALLRPLAGERDAAIGACVQGVIPARADAGAGVEAGAPLAHDDVAGNHFLAAEFLHAKALGCGIATVAAAAACFLVCHLAVLSMNPLYESSNACCVAPSAGRCSDCGYRRDSELSIGLAVAIMAAILLAALEF